MAEEEKKPHRWQPGIASPNPNGRPKGSSNKKKAIGTKVMMDLLFKLVTSIHQENDIKEMKGIDKVKAVISILPLLVAKPAPETSDKSSTGATQIIIKYEDKPLPIESDYEELPNETDEEDYE